MAHGPARDAVLTAYSQSLIRKLAQELSGKPGFTRSDEEDLQQELVLHLLEKAHYFNPNRGSPNTFAKQVIQSGYFTILRNRGRLKRSAGFRTLSLEQTSALRDKETTMLRDLIEGSDLERRTGAVGDCASLSPIS
jgi:RNA polymerase sigma-70 factor, ECF subfamily